MNLISIILNTANRPIELGRILGSIELNTYQNKEVIIVDDSRDKEAQITKDVVSKLKKELSTNILYMTTKEEGLDNNYRYNLAAARNIGVSEAMGNILMFLDDRYELDIDALDKIALNCMEDTWHYGKKRIKGTIVHKRPFIENFSWLFKKDFRKFGCFNERINKYGGLSQDIRERWESSCGLKFNQEDVFATEITRSQSNKNKASIAEMKMLLWKLNH